MRLLIILFLLFPLGVFADGGHIVISEIQTYGTGAKDEFVRLYNPTDSAIDISGWKLTKKTSSGNESNLVSSFEDGAAIPANSGFLITHKTDYAGAETADATFSGATYSVADNNTVLLYNNEGIPIDKVGFGTAADFESAPASNPEPGSSIIRKNNYDTDSNANDFMPKNGTGTQPQNTGGNEISDAPALASFGDIVINEVMPNPVEGKEWIEFHNATSQNINIDGWKIQDGSNEIYNLAGAIYAHSFITIEIINRLNNSGDAVCLSDANNYLIAQLAYGDWKGSAIEAPEKGQSIMRQPDGTYIITGNPTKNYENLIKQENDETIKQKTSSTTPQNDISNIKQYIIISEILPNPEGSDTSGEWIELYSSSDENINLGGLYLDDSEGGSGPYQIPGDSIITAGDYLLFTREKTNIALNNTNDSARILDSNKEEIINVEYDDAGEGFSYAFLDDGWQWTAEPTPLENNKAIKQENRKTGADSNSAQNYAAGIIVVPPNIFNTQIMYIDGLQLYMYYADWPELQIGDKISAWGTPSTYYGEPRLKLKNKNSIQVISHNNALEPMELAGSLIDDETVGKFVSAEGEVIEASSKKIFIDAGGTELLIYNKTGIDFLKFKERDTIKATGILSKYNDDYRLLPRNENDMILIKTGSEAPEKIDEKKSIWQYIASTLAISGIAGGIYIRRRRCQNIQQPG